MSKKTLVVLVAVLLGLPAILSAAPGDLDTTFNGVGTKIVLFDEGSSGNAVVMQTDGKIVMAGQASIGGITEFAVARLLSSGTLDTSFNVTGSKTVVIGTTDAANNVIMQADGKIVVAGFATVGGVSTFGLARFNTNGSLDTSFNLTGTQSLLIGDAAVGYHVAIQSDGKIVVAGQAVVSGNTEFAVARFNIDGSLDTSFNSTGTKTIAIGDGNNARARGVKIQSDGKIVLMGDAQVGGISEFAVARLLSTGVLDTSFNTTGTATVACGNGVNSTGGALQADGKILVVGSDTVNGFNIARFTTNGLPDSSFNLNGTQSIVLGTYSGAHSVAVQQNGKIVMTGYIQYGDFGDFAVVRLNIDGSLDTASFQGVGYTTVALGDGGSAGNGVTLQSDGKIVVAGYVSVGGISYMLGARFLGDPIALPCCQIFWGLYNAWNV